jgi:hypothetical protein
MRFCRKEFQIHKKLEGILGRNALPANRNQQCIGHLHGPLRRDNGAVTRPELGEQRVGGIGGFIGKAPRE